MTYQGMSWRVERLDGRVAAALDALHDPCIIKDANLRYSYAAEIDNPFDLTANRRSLKSIQIKILDMGK
jgi:hypothetical protein